MEEITKTSKILEMVEDNHLKYRKMIDTIDFTTNCVHYSPVPKTHDILSLSVGQFINTFETINENSFSSSLVRLGVNTKDTKYDYPSLTHKIEDSVFGGISFADPISLIEDSIFGGISFAHPMSLIEDSIFGGISFAHPMSLIEDSVFGGISFAHPMSLIEDSVIYKSISSENGFLFTKPKEESITAILGKFDYPSLVTKNNDFLSITEKGYNFGNLQTINYFLGDVATSAIQGFNGKFDNYSLENVTAKVTKDLKSIDFKRLNKLADGFLEWKEKIKVEVTILIDELKHFLRKEGFLIPKNIHEFLDFWFGYNEKNLGLNQENRNNFKLHENDLFLYHSCKEVKFRMRLDTMEEAFDIVWKEIDKRNQKPLPPSPTTPILENNISVPISEKQKKDAQEPNKNQKQVLRIIVEQLKEGVQKTDAINFAFPKTKYKNDRQIWNIFRSVEDGTLKFKELTEILNSK